MPRFDLVVIAPEGEVHPLYTYADHPIDAAEVCHAYLVGIGWVVPGAQNPFLSQDDA